MSIFNSKFKKAKLEDVSIADQLIKEEEVKKVVIKFHRVIKKGFESEYKAISQEIKKCIEEIKTFDGIDSQYHKIQKEIKTITKQAKYFADEKQLASIGVENPTKIAASFYSLAADADAKLNELMEQLEIVNKNNQEEEATLQEKKCKLEKLLSDTEAHYKKLYQGFEAKLLRSTHGKIDKERVKVIIQKLESNPSQANRIKTPLTLKIKSPNKEVKLDYFFFFEKNGKDIRYLKHKSPNFDKGFIKNITLTPSSNSILDGGGGNDFDLNWKIEFAAYEIEERSDQSKGSNSEKAVHNLKEKQDGTVHKDGDSYTFSGEFEAGPIKGGGEYTSNDETDTHDMTALTTGDITTNSDSKSDATGYTFKQSIQGATAEGTISYLISVTDNGKFKIKTLGDKQKEKEFIKIKKQNGKEVEKTSDKYLIIIDDSHLIEAIQSS